MNEIEAIRWQLGLYHAMLTQQMDRLYNALEELQRTSLLLMNHDRVSDEKIDGWLKAEGFAVDKDGFFQSQPLLSVFRKGNAPRDAISLSWGRHLMTDQRVRQEMYRYRNIGPHLKHIRDRLGDVGWIYYQSTSNTSLQHPYIDQCTAIPYDFDWTAYHTFVSVSPENNPQREIRWAPPSIDYAGEGMIICVSIPVWRDDVFIGLWSIDLPIRYLYRDFASVKSHPDQMQFIIDQEGMLLLHDKLHAEIDQTRGRIFLHPVAELGGQWEQMDLDRIIGKKEGTLEIKDAIGNEWLFCYSYMPGVEWILFSGLPRSSMEEAAAQRLRQAFQQIADGNFTHRIESSPTNALPELIDEFNRMSLRLDQAERHREEMERQLRNSQKLEAIGRLAGGVAHDYNNITNIIMGYTELALDKLNERDPLYADLDEIFKAAKRSRELTRQLLAFARRQSVEPKVLDINHAVDGILKMLKRLIGEDIELIWNPREGIWPIEIDPSQIDQILANLCVNARDAISGVGKIIIETSDIEFDDSYCSLHQEFIPGEFVMLSVSDNGSGMDAATQEKIFEPFFSTKALGKGTGLGLATVYGIVKQNNGFINVYSEPSKGSTFKIYIPRVKGKSVESVSDQASEIPLGHNETLLLVEDEEGILKLLERMLQHLGYRVLAEASPIKAIATAKSYQGKIDLLLTDVIMPQLNGNDLANQLQSLIPGLRVLFMSGYTSNVISDRGLLGKDILIIQKPFSKKDIASKISEVLSKPASC